jgi:hypothetical protein
MKRSAALAAILISSAASAEPFHTSDQNPLLIGFGLPMPFSARLLPKDSTSFEGTLN